MITKTTRVMQRTLIIKKKLQKEKLLVLKGEFRQLELVIQDQNQQVVVDFNWLELFQIWVGVNKKMRNLKEVCLRTLAVVVYLETELQTDPMDLRLLLHNYSEEILLKPITNHLEVSSVVILNLQEVYLGVMQSHQEAYLVEVHLVQVSLELNQLTVINLLVDYLVTLQEVFLEIMEPQKLLHYLAMHQLVVALSLAKNPLDRHCSEVNQENHYLVNKNLFSEKVLVKKTIIKKMKLKTMRVITSLQTNHHQLLSKIKLVLKAHSPKYLSVKFQNSK
jgi:hypothetical protein